MKLSCSKSLFDYLPSQIKILLVILFLTATVSAPVHAQENVLAGKDAIFWHTNSDNSISWDLSEERRLPHGDNIEMSGPLVSGIIRYKVDAAKHLLISRDIIFPQLRRITAANESPYRAYLRSQYNDDILPVVSLSGKRYEPGSLDAVRINGKIEFFFRERDGIKLVRTLFPSMTRRCFVEKWTLINTSKTDQTLNIASTESNQEEVGLYGVYKRKIFTDARNVVTIPPAKKYEFGIYFTATRDQEPVPSESFAVVEKTRNQYLESVAKKLVLKSPDPVINTLFYFSKIRAAESIFQSKLGLVHSPGGSSYYAGIWANDQAEYSGPFFAYSGYDPGREAALNTYRIFLKNMPKDGGRIWPSFEMDVSLPTGEKDRGDAAMIAFGATHYLLASGDKKQATEIWPLIEWSLEYCRKHKTAEGVIASESDELEGRFPTGSANLSTSCLYYGALNQTVLLAKAMDKPQQLVSEYEQQAQELAKAIESYFGANMDGLETYKYYKENTTLRSWICLPLVVGLDSRKQGTLDALFNKLWTPNGVLTEGDTASTASKTFWDRGTLYAFRGAFKAGAADQALERLMSYSRTRLTGFRVPYAVEAWPEGSMAHLSAESALYCRIFTEGVLGMEPVSFQSFSLRPNLPEKWDSLELERISAFNTSFDVRIRREKGKLNVSVFQKGKVILNKVVDNNTKLFVTLR